MSTQFCCDWVGVGSLIVGFVSFVYAVISDEKRRSQRHWVHMSLVNLKPSIQGPNKDEVIKAINNMLEFLKPPGKQRSGGKSSAV